ncbi:hypothetical protein SteCoe_1021 [Stentor coeruleus]|uniref:Uncharacterized protein n=1 Tax=Stentor coeruleus TaxID=5963 RepID=A0A1R2D2V9_9CILI|nr:hypothetical protein SteCoe_1021 [Stentor coeruleus]
MLFSCRTITPSARVINSTILSARRVLSARNMKNLVFTKEPIKVSCCLKKITPIKVFNRRNVCDASMSTTERSFCIGDKLLNTREFRQYSSKLKKIKRLDSKSPTSFLNSLDVLFDRELKGQKRKNTKEGNFKNIPKAIRVKGFLGSRKFVTSKHLGNKV